ncbi:hypothetical protein B484DRAFT_390682 [Ochromonadaceae sp. CCMP2298]|nr:hypothetical protein B484DRAFT_390682 [Ochromonadaceae sp. CCMP2298]
METPLGSEADDGGVETTPRIQRNLKAGQKKEVKNFLNAQLRMRPRDDSGDSRARRQFDDIMIADAIAFVGRKWGDRRVSVLEIKRIHNPHDPSLQPIPASKVTKKRTIQISSEEALERVAQREEVQAAEREVVEARRRHIVEDGLAAIEAARPFAEAECDDEESAKQALTSLHIVRRRCSAEQGRATHDMSVALEESVTKLLGIFSFAAWAKAEVQVAQFNPVNFRPALQPGGMEPMRSARFGGPQQGARCPRSEPENLAGGSRGVFNSQQVYAHTLEVTLRGLVARGDLYLSRLSNERVGGGGESSSSSSSSSDIDNAADRRASEAAVSTAFDDLSKMARDHNERFPTPASAPKTSALCFVNLPAEGGTRMCGMDFKANAVYYEEFLDLFKAVNDVTDEPTLHAAQGRATGRHRLYD